jgi:hypothetical protein
MSDQVLEQLRAAWAAVARYSVIRREPGKPDQVLGTGLPIDQARALEAAENKAIEQAPGFRRVMSRPLAGIELENREEALAASRSRSA